MKRPEWIETRIVEVETLDGLRFDYGPAKPNDSVWSRMSPAERARWDSMDRADAAANVGREPSAD